jgi:threonine dehydratase
VSTGNTGKAVAKAARELAIPAHIFCTGLPAASKYNYIRQNAGTVHVVGSTFSETAVAAAGFAADHDLAFCSPGASWPFAYGAGSVATEILEDEPTTAVIFAPIGGGGLVSGIGVALDAWAGIRPRLVGVQAAGSPYVHDLFYRRDSQTVELPTVADCLAGDLEADAIIVSMAHAVLDAVVLLSDDQLLDGARQLAANGISVEPGAAAAFVAAKLSLGDAQRPGRICAVISGGGGAYEPPANSGERP